MMTLDWAMGWWNLIFVVPFGIALAYLAVYVFTGLTFGDVDVDAGGHDFDAGHDLHAGHDVHAGHDAGAAAHDADGHDAEHGHQHPILEILGVGRLPLSVLAMNVLFIWGISGFVATQWLHDTIADGASVALRAVPFAAVVTFALTALIGRLVPKPDGPSTRRRDLEGREGVAVLAIGESFGLARVSPADGSASVQVPCRVAEGQPPIPANAPVVLLRFDRAEQLFYVSTPLRLAAATREPDGATVTSR